jgi:tetratricopeptide (TPR) repeat protein
MSSNNFDDVLSRYEHLFASGQYEEAAKLADTFLWKLYANGQEERVNQILVNTINTVEKGMMLSSAMLNLGNILYDKNLYDKARASYLHGIEITDPHDKALRVKLIHSIANTHFMEGNYLLARQYYRDSLKLSKEQKLDAGIAENLTQLSEIARTLGEYDDAEELGRSSLEINIRARRDRGSMRSTQSLCNLAIQLEAIGRSTKAKDLLSFCLEALRSNENKSALELVQHTVSGLPSLDIDSNGA